MVDLIKKKIEYLFILNIIENYHGCSKDLTLKILFLLINKDLVLFFKLSASIFTNILESKEIGNSIK